MEGTVTEACQRTSWFQVRDSGTLFECESLHRPRGLNPERASGMNPREGQNIGPREGGTKSHALLSLEPGQCNRTFFSNGNVQRTYNMAATSRTWLL